METDMMMDSVKMMVKMVMVVKIMIIIMINLNNKVVTIKLRNGRKISDRRITQLITAAGYQVVGIAR